jgi:hypothetical protein
MLKFNLRCSQSHKHTVLAFYLISLVMKAINSTETELKVETVYASNCTTNHSDAMNDTSEIAAMIQKRVGNLTAHALLVTVCNRRSFAETMESIDKISKEHQVAGNFTSNGS